MPKPRLSSTLNNCALHAFVPSIIVQVEALATDPDIENIHKAHYESLKDAFAEFYGFEKSSFSFTQFSEILNSYNSYDSQIILGPVLREFMKSNVETDYLGEGYCQSLTTISSETARYENLSPDIVTVLVGKPLGIKVECNQVAQGLLPVVDAPLDSIAMHHSGARDAGHWELSSDEAEIDSTDKEASKLEKIAEVFAWGDISLSECGLTLLKTQVQLTAIGARQYLNILDEKAQQLVDDFMRRDSLMLDGITYRNIEPMAVSQWSDDLRVEAKQAQDHKRSRALFPEEEVVISAEISQTTQYKEKYRTVLESLFSNRDEIQALAASVKEKEKKPDTSLTDEELAAKLQAEEFESAGFKPR